MCWSGRCAGALLALKGQPYVQADVWQCSKSPCFLPAAAAARQKLILPPPSEPV